MKTFNRIIILSGLITCILFSVSCKKNTQSWLVGKWDRVNVVDMNDTLFYEKWEFASDGKLFIECSGSVNYIDSLNYKGELTYVVDSRNKITVSKDLFSDQWEIVLRKKDKLRIVHNYGENMDVQMGLDSREFVKE
jgi:hypothetical protein